MRMKVNYFTIPLLGLFLLTLLFRFTDFDNNLIALFYSETKGFLYKNQVVARFLYEYGCLPGLYLAGGGLFVYLASFFVKLLKPISKKGLFLALVMIIGPGIIINGVFKSHWGRPRPIETVRFGGEEQFLPVWQKGISGEGQSFPSGHSSVAFYLMSPFFIFRSSRHKKIAVCFLVFGSLYGLLMGVVRMAQGGHFPSDILWSAAFVYFTGAILSHYMDFSQKNEEEV